MFTETEVVEVPVAPAPEGVEIKWGVTFADENRTNIKTRKLSVDDKQVSAEVIYYDYQPDAYSLVMEGEYVLRRVRNSEYTTKLYVPFSGVTVCVIRVPELGIGGIGVAVCSDSDKYSRRVGHPVAFKRAYESLVEGGRFDVAAPYVQQCDRRVAISNIVTNIHTFYTTPQKSKKSK